MRGLDFRDTPQLGLDQALGLSPVASRFTLSAIPRRVIFRGRTSGRLGRWMVSTPFRSSASTWSASMPSGGVNERVNVPYDSSRV